MAMNLLIIATIALLIGAIALFARFYTKMMHNTYLNGVPEFNEEMMREVRKMNRLLQQLPDQTLQEVTQLQQQITALEAIYAKELDESTHSRKDVYRLIEANQHLASAQQDETVVQQAFLQEAIGAVRPLLS